MNTFRFAWRLLCRDRPFSLLAGSILATGIGATLSIFAVFNAVLLRPLPYRDPASLMAIRILNVRTGSFQPVSPADFIDIRRQSTVFQDIVAAQITSMKLTLNAEPEQLEGAAVTTNFFKMFGITMAIGRDLALQDEQSGDSVIVLSNDLWNRRFASSSQVCGQRIDLGGRRYTVVGVAPPEIGFPRQETEFWTPLVFGPKVQRGSSFLRVIGRLGPLCDVREAQAELSTIAKRLQIEYPATNKHRNAQVTPLLESIVGDSKTTLLVLLASAGLLLFITCANLATLLMARASLQRQQFSIQIALGASPLSIAKLILVQSMLLAAFSGAAAVVICWIIMQFIPAILVLAGLPRVERIAIDGLVLAFSVALSLVTGVVFGLIPAIRVSRLDPNECLKDTSRTIIPRQTAAYSGLTVLQIAVATVFLAAAGLLAKSLWLRIHVPLGFDPAALLVLEYDDLDATTVSQSMDRIRLLPGVQAVAVSDGNPVSPLPQSDYSVESAHPTADASHLMTGLQIVSNEYFRTMRIQLVKGRLFSDHDAPNSPVVAIVSEALSRQAFPLRDPLGQEIHCGRITATIVGVVGDVRHFSMDADQPTLYLPYGQTPWLSTVKVFVRSQYAPMALVRDIRSVIRDIGNRSVFLKSGTIEAALSRSVASPRLYGVIIAVFAGLSLIMALMGVVALTSYTVGRRMRNIAIRMTLGARERDIILLIVRHGFAMNFAGVILGLALVGTMTKVLSTFLYKVSPTDSAVLALASLLMVASEAAAFYIPVRRVCRLGIRAFLN